MAITSEFREAVQSGKMMRVHIMMKDSLLLDPTGAQFDEMEQYAMENMENIYTEHDGEKLSFDVNDWNEKYLNQQMVAAVNCFSKERIDLLKGMVRYLYKEKVSKIHSEINENPVQSHITRKQVGTGATVAGAALAVAGICTSHTVLTVGGIVVAGAGIALIISDKGEI